ncbi:MAG: hypothetical protein EB121_03755, partial [Alphaproteobacteria bacterium]|nr:hypothetical protein [Alphaproteobacteria bacterium]
MTKILAALLMVFLASCANITKDEVIDANQNLTRDDYRALRERATTETPPPIPDIKPIADDAPSALDDKTVSLSLTPDVPLKDVLMDLAQQAGLDLSLHPRVSGGISLNVNDQPLGLVLDRICELANLRWYDDNGFLHIEPDTPYWQNYALHYPSLSRNTESEVSIATNVFNDDVARQTNSTNSSRDISENNSRARVKSVAENNFWGEIEKSLGQILESDSDSDADSKSTSAKYTVNKQSGSVSVYGNQKVQNEVAVYLDDIQKKVGTQVLIDARIVEVELNENYRSGINWRTLLDNE